MFIHEKGQIAEIYINLEKYLRKDYFYLSIKILFHKSIKFFIDYYLKKEFFIKQFQFYLLKAKSFYLIVLYYLFRCQL